jgi:hypothetical protein
MVEPQCAQNFSFPATSLWQTGQAPVSEILICTPHLLQNLAPVFSAFPQLLQKGIYSGLFETT